MAKSVNKAYNAQELYLRGLIRDKRFINIWRILLLIIFLVVWESASRLELIDSFIFSSPTGIVKCFNKMLFEQNLLRHTIITLYETLISFSLLIIISLVIAVLMWRFQRLSKILEPYLVVLNSLPKSALAPLLLVWLGANMVTIIVAGISVGVFGAVINLYTGFVKTDAEQIKLIETLKGTRLDILKKVIIPSNLPIFVSIMKVNIGLCLVGVVIGEFFAANEGLGYLIIYGSQVFKLDMVVMSIALLSLLTIIFYRIIHLVEKYVLKSFKL